MSYKILISLFLISFLISCSSDDEFSEEKRELSHAIQKWNAAQIQNYKWTEILSCECGGPLLREIFVVNNIKESVDFDESLLFEGYTSEDVYDASKTVEEAFDFIQSLINQNVASLVVEYDDVYGFPNIISIDYDADFIDDEILYRYINFEIEN